MRQRMSLAAGLIGLLLSASVSTAINWSWEDPWLSFDGQGLTLVLDRQSGPDIAFHSGGQMRYLYKVGGSWIENAAGQSADGLPGLAIDSADLPAITHANGNYLYYNHKDGGGWHSEFVDTCTWGNWSGQWARTCFDSLNRPHIAYDVNIGSRPLKCGYRDSNGWHLSIASYWSAGGSPCLQFGGFDLDSDGHPHLLHFFDSSGVQRLDYVRWDGYQWQREIVEASFPLAHGCDLVLDASDNPHIVYNSEVTDDLKYAYRDRGGWHIETVDATGDVGDFPSIKLDYAGEPRVSYFDATNGNVKYAYHDATGWHEERTAPNSVDTQLSEFSQLLLVLGRAQVAQS